MRLTLVRYFALAVYALLTASCADGTPTPGIDLDASSHDRGRPDLPLPQVRDAEPDRGDDDRATGDPCRDGGDCRSGVCLEDYDGLSRCMDECSPLGGAPCPAGYVCRSLGNTGPDTRYACRPRSYASCEPCNAGATCGGGADCVDMPGGRYCAIDCSEDDFCPQDYACQVSPDGAWCWPENGTCAPCEDRDDDGYGEGDGCHGPDCNDDDPQVFPGADELCNGLDDDCDEAVDEAVELGGDEAAPCPEFGVCFGVPVDCIDGAWACRLDGRYEPDEVRCDGEDNDCDGQVDEVPGAGDACSAGVGLCERGGRLNCDLESGDLVCNARPGEPGDEVCNGQDDDCNGLIDDVPGVGEYCESGEGICRAAGNMECDPAIRRLACNAESRPAVDEICDGLDNDCDGPIDEGVLNACGGCGPAPAEACNGRDDDCDDAIDEHVQNACGECGVVPEEACNGLDDDCDDAVDENVQNACGACGAVPSEVCNGRDDDCDDTVDEGDLCGPGGVCRQGACEDRVCLDGESRVCGSDVGVCVAGRQMCANNRLGPCEGAVGPSGEVCNGLDDDCDGAVDNGASCNDPAFRCEEGRCRPRPCLPGETRPCGSNEGVCRAGLQTCGDDDWLPGCVGEVEPVAEQCDGVDRDCDGAVDEGDLCPLGRVCLDGSCVDRVCADGATRPCGLERGECRPGTETCVENAWGPCLDAVPPGVERCNGLDDDCDAQFDEQVVCPQPGEICVDGACIAFICNDGATRPCGRDLGVCRAGIQACVDNRWAPDCEGEVSPRDELCNGEDDDCDGVVDDGAPCPAGEVCRLGRCEVFVCDEGDSRPCGESRGECRQGSETCRDNRYGACIGAIGPVGEVCNQADDDCDGRTDEGALNRCGECGPEPAEDCNGRDDDCDGRVDEGVLNACGACGEPPQEVCNGRDEDCDGRVDEGTTNRCGGCGPVPAEVCNGRDDDCDGRFDEGDLCGGGQACRAGRCEDLVELCNAIDDDQDGIIDEMPPNTRGCFTFIMRYSNCDFRSWQGAWQTATLNEEANAGNCPPNPASPLAGCGGCATRRNFCPIPPHTGSYTTCWQRSDGRVLRTYSDPKPNVSVTREIIHCFNQNSGMNDYVYGQRCADLGAGWLDGVPLSMGFVGTRQPPGRWLENWGRLYVCESRTLNGQPDRYMAKNCDGDPIVRDLGWSLGP